MNILKIFGYSKNELIGQNINILIPKLFHKSHDLILMEQFEKDKLKFFDELNKRQIYFPNFIKKEVYGVSKMKFLIELNINIYFVKTEENKIVYIFEVENYAPKEIDLIKNNNNYSKFCVLTDENFLIQTFTPNCLYGLKLTYNEINSNYCIINYIKQFQEDYLTAINNNSIAKYSHINKTELILEEKFSEQKTNQNISLNIKKKIKNDLLNKKYSKKCKITWIKDKSDFTKSNIFIEKKKTITNKNDIDIELNLFMEIQKIIIKDKLIGYYFFFSKIRNKTYNNMSYQLKKNEKTDSNNYLLKVKKYQCKFRTLIGTNIINFNKYQSKDENSNNNVKNIFCSLIINPTKVKDKLKKELNNFRKKERKKSLDKNSKVTFKQVEDNSPINNCSYTNKYFPGENDSTITGEFIPTYSTDFTIDIKNMSFYQVNKYNNQLEYLDFLKREAINKVNKYKELLKVISKNSENSNESEEYESDEDSYSNLNAINSSDDISSNNLIYDHYRKQSSMSNNADKNSIKTSKIQTKKTKKDFQNKNDENINDVSINKSVNKKYQNKNNITNNFYKVKLNKIHFMIYDFYKDMIVEGNKNEIVSKVEDIMSDTKNMESIDLDKDERLSFLKSYRNKNKKNNKETKDTKNIEKIDISQTNIIDEEKLFKKKVHEALNKHKDEPPIIKLKIFIILSYFILILLGIIILSYNLSNIYNTSESLILFKSIFFIRYCSQISVYYLREMTLLSFSVWRLKGGVYVNFTASDKEEFKALIKEQIKKLFKENQSLMETIFSSSLPFSEKSLKNITDHKLYIRMLNFTKVQFEYDILTALVNYNSAFYNLASSTATLDQNHTDLANYIYNNLNGYKNGMNILIDIFQYELITNLKFIIKNFMIGGIIILILFIIFYILIMKNFFSSIKTRGNYMKVFYGINENILKNIIENCENLLNKLKSSEEQKYNEEKTENESNDENDNLEEDKKKQNNNISQNNYLKSSLEKNDNNRVSSLGITFIAVYTIFTLIFYLYFIYNEYFLINTVNKAIENSNYCLAQNDYHIYIMELFNIYREFLFDNHTVIDNMSSIVYMEQSEKTFKKNFKYIGSKNVDNLKSLGLISNKSLCFYYINDFFDSSAKCETSIGLISTYDFSTFVYNFLEEIKISKNIVKDKLENEMVFGNLTEYNYLDYIKNPLVPPYYLYYTDPTISFRLDLFNNETIHFKLNIMFFNIILPYIQENRKGLYSILNIGNAHKNVTVFFLLFLIVVTLVYLFYFLPIVIFLNTIIYKTKNMLSIIPLNILASQNGVSELLDISKEK